VISGCAASSDGSGGSSNEPPAASADCIPTGAQPYDSGSSDCVPDYDLGDMTSDWEDQQREDTAAADARQRAQAEHDAYCREDPASPIC
jgi:hypothetical protein